MIITHPTIRSLGPSKYYRIGVIGYSNNNFDPVEGQLLVNGGIYRMYRAALQQGRISGPSDVEIVSNAENRGIARFAYLQAKMMGFHTCGIASEQAKSLPLYPCERRVFQGQLFGDELHLFLNSVDGLLRVGGGLQCKELVRSFKAMVRSSPYPRYRGDLLEYDLIKAEVPDEGVPVPFIPTTSPTQ